MSEGPRLVFLYDGHCNLCREGAALMARLARPGQVELRDFQRPGVLAEFPQVSLEQCLGAAQLVAGDGRSWSGLAGILEVLATRSWLRPLRWLYRLPGIGPLADALYRWVARNRYRFLGRARCQEGTCRLH